MEAHLADLPTSLLRLADLAARKATPFDLMPNAPQRAAIAQALGIIGIKKLKFTGDIKPVGRTDWDLRGNLGATIVQSCVITLEPVTTRIDEPVQRSYLLNIDAPEEADVEMTFDENAEPLPASIDLYTVLIEALSLSMPAYPRAQGAEMGEAVFSQSGVSPMTDDDAKPFAGLGDLRNALEKKAD
tara:strand:- start:32353 stop:32910 length:558 start_codon:yes stop_codon:yes gene_type:complete